MDSVEALAKRLLPTLDVDFLQGEDFKSASWRCAFCLVCVFRLLKTQLSHARIAPLPFQPPLPLSLLFSAIPGFYKFAFLFSLEGTRRNIGPSSTSSVLSLCQPTCYDITQHMVDQNLIHKTNTNFPTRQTPHTEKDMVVELLPMVIGQRSEYTEAFVGFLNETKKEKEMITADQVRTSAAAWTAG